jgi:hypothetical protein
MIALRRLQLTANSSGVIGLALPPQAEAAEFWLPTAANEALAASRRCPPHLYQCRMLARPLRLELLRCPGGGESETFEVEACDAKGCLALPSLPSLWTTDQFWVGYASNRRVTGKTDKPTIEQLLDPSTACSARLSSSKRTWSRSAHDVISIGLLARNQRRFSETQAIDPKALKVAPPRFA